MRTAVLRTIGALNAWVYRASHGRLLGRFPGGAPVCLLTTRGRRSGRRRTVPLLYLQDGADAIVVASQGGAPTHPAWYLNLLAEPRATLQIGERQAAVIATEVEEPHRSRLWPRLLVMHRPYESYQQRTARRIPLIRLTPC